MKTLPPCLLYTQDAALAVRMKAFLRSFAKVQVAEQPVDMERALERFHPALCIFDLRSPECLELLGQTQAERPSNVLITVGVPRSDPLRAAQAMGAFANEDVNGDRQRIQAQVKRGLEHLRLLQENRMLRETNGGTPRPVASPPPADSGRAGTRMQLPHFSRAIRHFDDIDALLDGIVEGVASSMMVSRVGIFSRTRNTGTYRLRAGIRYLEDTRALEYDERDPLVHWLEVHAHLVSRGNLEHIPESSDRMLLQQALDRLGAEVIIPMHARGHIIGWLFVGHRATGLPFEYMDLEDLLAVAEHGGTILDNALLYEEVTLQKTLAETVLQSMPTGIVAVGPDGIVRWFNNAAQDMIGFRAPEIVGEPVERLGTQVADVLRRALQGEVITTPREWTEVRTSRSLATQTRLLLDGAACLGAVALVHDRTMENALREKEEQLERATFWTELAASMSHEVRNPLVAIKTFAQLLPERYEDPEFRSEFSELVAKEVDRLNKIIEQINDFANPPALQFHEVSLDEAVRKGLDLASLKVPRNGVAVDASLTDDLPTLRGDSHALAECFAELIANAMEASRGRKKPHIDIHAERAEPVNGTPGGIVITVKDNGSGIPDEIRDKVFSPFCTTKARGMGLGLPIVRRTVIDHNGRVEIKTGKGGTVVTVALPTEYDNGLKNRETPTDH